MMKEKKKLTSEELKNIISRNTISTFKFYILDTKAADQIDLWLDELIQDNTEKVIKLLILSEGCTAEGASKICKKIQSVPNPIVGIVVRNEDYHLWDLGIASILSACDASVLINNYYHKNSKKNSLFQLSLYHYPDKKMDKQLSILNRKLISTISQKNKKTYISIKKDITPTTISFGKKLNCEEAKSYGIIDMIINNVRE